MRKRAEGGKPPRGSLRNAKIASRVKVAEHADVEVLFLHGMGPQALQQLKAAMRNRSPRCNPCQRGPRAFTD
jgi:hypothetical protein